MLLPRKDPYTCTGGGLSLNNKTTDTGKTEHPVIGHIVRE